jgi:hypothetical protein
VKDLLKQENMLDHVEREDLLNEATTKRGPCPFCGMRHFVFWRGLTTTNNFSLTL